MIESFLDKLKRRRIWKTIVGFPAAAFVILQAVDFFITKYGLNPKTLTFTLVILCGGFIIALIWNWLHGEVGKQTFTRPEIVSYISIACIAIPAAFYLSNRSGSPEANFSALNTENEYRLAVLPFESISEDASMEYLSQGIPENLINRLSQNTNLKMVSRASSFILDADLRSAKGVLETLKANLMLTGRIERIGNAFVVNCQLIDTRNNTQIWGEKVSHDDEDILAIEEQMVSSLMTSIPEKFKKNQVLSKSWSDNPEAQSHYMKGRALSYGSTAEETELALNHFREAIKIDPKFVAAYVAIANEQVVQAMFSTDTRVEIFNEARIAVQTALALDPNYGEAYTVQAAIKFYMDKDWEAAEEAFKKAIRLDENNSIAKIRYAFFLTTMRRFDEALVLAEKAAELDPISISSLHNLGWVNLVAGNYTAAEKAFGEALEIHPNWIWGYVKRGYSHAFQGNCESALKDQQKARELLGDWGNELIESCLIFILDQCDFQEMKAEATKRYLSRINPDNYTDPMAMAFLYCSNENNEECLHWLQVSIDEEITAFYQFNLDFAYPKEILEDPRFIRMKEYLDLP